MTRHQPLPRGMWFLCAWIVTITACSGPIFRPQSPEPLLEDPELPGARLVSEFTHPYGLNFVSVEGVSLVTGLAGTGGDPPPSPQRAALLAEMSRLQVENANQVLASPNTALVMVRGVLRPGMRKGDRFDIDVQVPRQSEASSLRGGWVLQARLSEMAVLGNQLHKGHDVATAEGPLLVDPTADSERDPALATRGRILGGGVILKDRPMGLIIAHPHQSARFSRDIANSINQRFHSYDTGLKQGVATPKSDEFIELRVHPRYKDNVGRYMRVIHSVAINETVDNRQLRLKSLEHQLLDPLTSATAALRLEAIGGDQAMEILRRGSRDKDPEVRFYSSEALAYLDDTQAVAPLAEAARNEPAFRVHALAALSAMDDVNAYEALHDLLSVSSAETRYGAFRALWAMNPHAPLVRGEKLGDQFSLHVLDVDGPPMVHVTRSYRPEIVFFGTEQRLQLPLVLDAGQRILVNGMSGSKITVSKFQPGAEPEQRETSTDLKDVIRAIVDLGGTYPDVVQALQQAKQSGALPSRFRVDAVPETGRVYDRSQQDSTDEASPGFEVASPLPDLFARQR